MTGKIVIGLQFGDEGKGRLVDYLCFSSDNPIVVRFSGGQQVGHTVILNGIKHIHSNFGSGTLRGVPTFYSEHCCVYLNSMSVELELLKKKGVVPKVFLHPFVKMTTPYDQAFNRIMERENRHGSCGMGIGTTMKRNIETGYKLSAIDFQNPEIAKAKLRSIKEYYYDLIIKNNLDCRAFEKEYLENEEYFLTQIGKNLFTIADYFYLNNYDSLIFEGSQGILLDMDHGFFPNVTYANTTSKNALEICKLLNIEPDLWYVTRCYQTRHGNGWMSETGPVSLIKTEEEINITNEWQGNFRTQELDYGLLNYSLDIDQQYIARNFYAINKNLVVTCLDQRPDFNFDYSKLKQFFANKIECYGATNDIQSIFDTFRSVRAK